MRYPAEPYDAANGLVRVYPAHPATTLLVWIHGGGFTGGSIDMPEADWVARTLANHGITVVSVDYRRADTTVHFPAPSDDVVAAWHWTLDHATELGAEPQQLVLGGASAGANLAAGAILRMRDDPVIPLPIGVVLVYPTLHAEQPSPDPELRAALDANPQADIFGPTAVTTMYKAYLDGKIDLAPSAAIPGLATPNDLAAFPPTLILNADVDELRISGELFASALRAESRQVDEAVQTGTIHGFLNIPDDPAALRALQHVVDWTDTLLGNLLAAPPTR